MYAVVVTFQIAPGDMPAFLRSAYHNAKTSVAQEEGCYRFDVCSDPERPNEVFLYELYEDRAALDAHLGTAHFHNFDVEVAPMIAAKDIRTYQDVRA